MNKHLTDAEINLAREIFLRTMQIEKTQDFNHQMAIRSIRLSRLFTAAVDDENRDCNKVDIDLAYTGISVEDVEKSFDAALPGELDVFHPKGILFTELSPSFKKFNIYANNHVKKYAKIPNLVEDTVTCNYFEGEIQHSFKNFEYPDWVVSKFVNNKNGVVYGCNTSCLRYNTETKSWLPVGGGDYKICVLMYEQCFEVPENSMVSTDLPF